MCLCTLIVNAVYSQSINYEQLESSKIQNTILLNSGDYAVSGYHNDETDPTNGLSFGILELVNANGESKKSFLFDEDSNIHIVGEDVNGELICIVDSAINSTEADEYALYKVDPELNDAVFVSQLDFSNITRELGEIYSFETIIRNNLLYVYGLGNISQVGNKSFILAYDLEREEKKSFGIISTSALTNTSVSLEYAVAFYSNGDFLQVSKRLSQGTGPIFSRHSIDGKELWNKELSKNYRFYDVEINSKDEIFAIGDLKIESANKTDYLGIIVKFDENGAWQKQQRITQDPSLGAQTESLVELHKIIITDSDNIFALGMDGGGFMDFIPIIFGQFDEALSQAEISRFSNQPAEPTLFQTVTKNIFINDSKVTFFHILEIFDGTSKGITGVIDLDILSAVEPISPKHLNVYPNPVHNVLRIQNNAFNENESAKLSIFDATGRRVLVSQFQKEIDVSTLNSGLFYLVLYSETQRKIVSFNKF